MNADALNQVIDKLAEKAGVAADALKPIAQELIAQTRAIGMAYVIVGCVAFMACGILAALFCQAVKQVGEANHQAKDRFIVKAAISAVLGMVALVCGLAGVITGLPMWLAPLRSLLIK